EQQWSLVGSRWPLTRAPLILPSTADGKNAQLEVPSVLIRLPIGHYLGLDALALANHIQCSGKVLQRKSRGEHRFRVNDAAANETNSRLNGEQDGLRAKYGNLASGDVEWRERTLGLFVLDAEDD